MKYNLLFAVLCLCLSLPSCKEEDDDCSTAWESGTHNEFVALETARDAYFNNTSDTGLCNTYRTAALNYKNALQPYGECEKLTGTDRDEYQIRLEDTIDESIGNC